MRTSLGGRSCQRDNLLSAIDDWTSTDEGTGAAMPRLRYAPPLLVLSRTSSGQRSRSCCTSTPPNRFTTSAARQEMVLERTGEHELESLGLQPWSAHATLGHHMVLHSSRCGACAIAGHATDAIVSMALAKSNCCAAADRARNPFHCTFLVRSAASSAAPCPGGQRWPG